MNLRAIINAAIAGAEDPDQVARLEICREYFTNPDFREWLQDFLWEKQQRAETGEQLAAIAHVEACAHGGPFFNEGETQCKS